MQDWDQLVGVNPDLKDLSDDDIKSMYNDLLESERLGKALINKDSYFESKKLNNVNVRPSGNCLFASIAYQLNLNNIFTNITHDQIRQDVCNYFLKIPDINFRGKRIKVENLIKVISNREEYINFMSRDRIWGSDIELYSIAYMYNIKIYLILFEGDDIIYQQINHNAEKNIVINLVNPLHFDSTDYKSTNHEHKQFIESLSWILNTNNISNFTCTDKTQFNIKCGLFNNINCDTSKVDTTVYKYYKCIPSGNSHICYKLEDFDNVNYYCKEKPRDIEVDIPDE